VKQSELTDRSVASVVSDESDPPTLRVYEIRPLADLNFYSMTPPRFPTRSYREPNQGQLDASHYIDRREDSERGIKIMV